MLLYRKVARKPDLILDHTWETTLVLSKSHHPSFINIDFFLLLSGHIARP